MTTPTVSLSNPQNLSVTSSTMSRTPSNHSSTSKASISTESSFYSSHSNLCILIDAALGTSNQLPSSPSHHNPSANSNSNLSNSNSTFFWSTLTQSLHSLPSINYLSSYELLEFPRSSYLGSIAPTSNSNEFIRAQVCVTSCGYKSKIATKPIRIREHFSRCNFRKKHFEGENIDHLGRLATLEICALREKNTMNELASKNSLGRK